jgi:predicted nucleic acid-binding protein
MNGNEYLLDSNVILYLSGNQTLAKYLHHKVLYASVITEMELLSFKKLSASEEKGIRSFLSEFRIIYIDEAVKSETMMLRRQYGLKLPDSIIAATAISLNLTLITADKQFKKVNNLLLELYES